MIPIKLNLKKFLIYCFNFFHSFLLFFSLKRSFLRFFGFKISSGVTVHRGVYFYDFGKCFIGKNTTINKNSIIDNRGSIYIGENVNVSHSVQIYSMGHDIDSKDFKVFIKSVSICDNAWIFPNVLIMPGVIVNEGAVVLPGSVVTKSLEAYSVYGGNPAKFIKKRTKTPSYIASFPVWFGV